MLIVRSLVSNDKRDGKQLHDAYGISPVRGNESRERHACGVRTTANYKNSAMSVSYLYYGLIVYFFTIKVKQFSDIFIGEI